MNKSLVYFRVTRGQVLNCSPFLNKYAVSWRCFYTLDGRWHRAQTMLHRQQSRSRWAGFYTPIWWAAVAGTKQQNISVLCRLQCLWFDLNILVKLNVQCNLSTVKLLQVTWDIMGAGFDSICRTWSSVNLRWWPFYLPMHHQFNHYFCEKWEVYSNSVFVEKKNSMG